MGVEEDIWNAVLEANRAWKGGNPRAVASLFDADVVLAFANSDRRLVGREAMVRHYVEQCQRFETFEFRELAHTVDVVGDTAVVSYSFRFIFEANGTPHEELGREILVFRHGASGWLAIWRSRVPLTALGTAPASMN
jgi:ketosteroid isomerase-like protein